MNTKSQKMCLWAGVLCPVFLFAGLWPAAGFFPPHLPTASAEEIAAIYRQNATGIRVGMFLMMIGGALLAPIVAVISAQMRRIENSRTPVLSYLQLATGSPITLILIIGAMIWSWASFRPDRPPELTLLINDLGWIFFVMPFTLGSIQNLAIGFAIIFDKNRQPVFDRWVGYFNLWMAVFIVPAGLVVMFKTGPFAWNGLLAFWVPASVFFLWFFVMTLALFKAIRQQEAESGQANG